MDLLRDMISARLNPSEECHLSVWWNNFLILVALFNGTLFLRTWTKRTKKTSTSQITGVWTTLSKNQSFLAGAYVFACAVRGIWPRMDEDRYCFYNSWISVVFVGRSLATIAELCYCAQLCLATICISGHRRLADILFIANVVAQSCCWYSVITQDQRGHIIEESIWLLTGAALTAFAWRYSMYRSFGDSMTFLRVVSVIGVLYVLFMSVVDIPMYYNRYLRDVKAGRHYLTLSDGLLQTLTCQVVTREDSYWREEMPWMTLYFTVAVWSSIWLSSADMSRVYTKREHKIE